MKIEPFWNINENVFNISLSGNVEWNIKTNTPELQLYIQE